MSHSTALTSCPTGCASGQQGGKSGQSAQGGKGLPMPVGLLFHILYVTFWSWAYVVLFRDRLTFSNALVLAAVLWAIVLVAIFPFVGWGFLGLGISPKLIIASAVPHLLFAIFLWGLCRIGFRRAAAEQAYAVP